MQFLHFRFIVSPYIYIYIYIPEIYKSLIWTPKLHAPKIDKTMSKSL